MIASAWLGLVYCNNNTLRDGKFTTAAMSVCGASLYDATKWILKGYAHDLMTP